MLIRGRIVPPSTRNFRVAVGQINLIFNWEIQEENHYRNGRVCTVQKGHALTPGTMHDILIQEDDGHVTVFVDDEVVYETEAELHGTVTVHPELGSSIAISELIIEGEPDPERVVSGHSHWIAR